LLYLAYLIKINSVTIVPESFFLLVGLIGLTRAPAYSEIMLWRERIGILCRTILKNVLL
jgi:hypothetical protein